MRVLSQSGSKAKSKTELVAALAKGTVEDLDHIWNILDEAKKLTDDLSGLFEGVNARVLCAAATISKTTKRLPSRETAGRLRPPSY